MKLDEEKAKTEEELKTKFKPLCSWLEGELKESIAVARVSTRLSTAPCAVVPGPVGLSPRYLIFDYVVFT